VQEVAKSGFIPLLARLAPRFVVVAVWVSNKDDYACVEWADTFADPIHGRSFDALMEQGQVSHVL
jgi:hypothetical protein